MDDFGVKLPAHENSPEPPPPPDFLGSRLPLTVWREQDIDIRGEVRKKEQQSSHQSSASVQDNLDDEAADGSVDNFDHLAVCPVASLSVKL